MLLVALLSALWDLIVVFKTSDCLLCSKLYLALYVIEHEMQVTHVDTGKINMQLFACIEIGIRILRDV